MYRASALGIGVDLNFIPGCGRCVPCASGRPSLCEPGVAANLAGTLLGGEKRWLDADGLRLHHFLGVSGFAQYTVVSARSVVSIDHDLAPRSRRYSAARS